MTLYQLLCNHWPLPTTLSNAGWFGCKTESRFMHINCNLHTCSMEHLWKHKLLALFIINIHVWCFLPVTKIYCINIHWADWPFTNYMCSIYNVASDIWVTSFACDILAPTHILRLKNNINCFMQATCHPPSLPHFSIPQVCLPTPLGKISVYSPGYNILDLQWRYLKCDKRN